MAAVLDAFASKLADILMGMAKEEVELLLGVPGEIAKLETTLGDLSSIFTDAERRRICDSAVERWVRELKDVMYDADDILDLCQIMKGGVDLDPSSSTVADSKTNPACWNVSAMFSCFRNPFITHEIGRKIQLLNQRLADLEKRSSRFGFITQAINSSAYTTNKGTDSLSDHNQKTGSSIIPSDVVGEKIDEDAKKIIDLLLNKAGTHAGLSSINVFVAVAITGTGGIGKTTLARMVFNDTVVKENFDERIWLSVNKEVNQVSVLQNVIAALGSSYDGSVRDKALLEHALKEAVRQKKFLLVMDDVWSESENVWSEILRAPLNDSAPGSRVLVTTRNEGVARKMKAQHLHRVNKLQQEDAWILLKKQVVSSECDETEVNGLEDVGRKILKRCDGLPLAIKVVGGLLLNKSRTKDAWMDVYNHYSWSLAGIDDDINKAVYLSYEELPSHLKQCFVHCSLFPKDELIKSGVIIHLWIAEGYIHNKMISKSAEDLGFEYYKELVSRNLLEPDKGFYSQSACTMHDVVRSFAHYIMKDKGLLISECRDLNRILGSSKLRHLSISNKVVEWEALQRHTSLRTLMVFRSPILQLNNLWTSLCCLRVLYIDDVNLVELPDSICHLKHLRYLSLHGTSISTIPESIGDLKFLQIIDLGGCTNVSQLPNSILNLRKLRSLNLRYTAITSVPRGFGNLEELVNVVGFPTDSDGTPDGWCSLEELGPLSKLKELEIRGLEKAHSGSMAAKAMLSEHNLTYLVLSFTSILGENGEVKDKIQKEEHKRIEEVLANLCPPTCTEVLDIKGYFARGLPQWMVTMSTFGSLRRLVLEDYACCTKLPNGLGQLPFLDYFWIHRAPSVQRIEHDFLLPFSVGDTNGKDGTTAITETQIDRRQAHHMLCGAVVPFPKLAKLGFEGMLGLMEWEWQQQIPAMPALEVLTVDNCKLQCLPAGLAYHACRLRILDLRNILHLVCVENFPSLVKLRSYDNPRIERISNNPSLQLIVTVRCPGLHVLQDLPSLRSIEWWDLDAETLPQCLKETKLNKLRVGCSPRLLKLIALQDDSSEWGKVRHVQQLKAIGWKSYEEEESYRYIYYTKDPYSFEANMGEPTDDEEEDDVRE